jgi:hypothetical protein
MASHGSLYLLIQVKVQCSKLRYLKDREMWANSIHCFNEQLERDKGTKRVLERKKWCEGMTIRKKLFPAEFQLTFSLVTCALP